MGIRLREKEKESLYFAFRLSCLCYFRQNSFKSVATAAVVFVVANVVVGTL